MFETVCLGSKFSEARLQAKRWTGDGRCFRCKSGCERLKLVAETQNPGKVAQMRQVWEGVSIRVAALESHTCAYKGEAVRLQGLCKDIRHQRLPPGSRTAALWR